PDDRCGVAFLALPHSRRLWLSFGYHILVYGCYKWGLGRFRAGGDEAFENAREDPPKSTEARDRGNPRRRQEMRLALARKKEAPRPGAEARRISVTRARLRHSA